MVSTCAGQWPSSAAHVVEQPVGVVGDPQVPLRQLARLDDRAAPLAPTVDHLLVGQHGRVLRAPVHDARRAVGQPALVHRQEQPLRPAQVLRVGRVQPTGPVERDAVPPQRPRLRLDVVVRERRRVLTAPDRGVLRGQPERVPADGEQHVEPAQPPVPGDHVGQREHLRVAHVQVARRVREHRQQVPARPAAVVPGLEHPQPLPDGLPLALDLLHDPAPSSPVLQVRARKSPSHRRGSPR